MHSFTKTLRDIGFLTIALTLALVANFAYGQWANPTATPTGNNAAAPINIAGGYQYKAGSIGAVQLLAVDRVRSDLYCDLNGENCTAATALGGGGSELPSGTWCGLRLTLNSGPQSLCEGNDPSISCPAGFRRTMFARMGSLGGDWYTCFYNPDYVAPPPPPPPPPPAAPPVFNGGCPPGSTMVGSGRGRGCSSTGNTRNNGGGNR